MHTYVWVFLKENTYVSRNDRKFAIQNTKKNKSIEKQRIYNRLKRKMPS